MATAAVVDRSALPHCCANHDDPTADHRVQFYRSPEYMCSCVADFAVEGIEKKAAVVIVFIKRTHEVIFRRALHERNQNMDHLIGQQQLTVIDCEGYVPSLLENGLPTMERVMAAVKDILDAGYRRYGYIYLFGIGVDVLCSQGNIDGAIRLEEIWTDIMKQYPMSMMCGYDLASFYKAEASLKFKQICYDMHRKANPAEDIALLDNADDQRKAIAVLQQKALMLETELKIRADMEQQLMRKQQALEEANAAVAAANLAKSNFLAMISHELRTPLVTILDHADVLRQAQIADTDRVESSNIIANSGLHLRDLVNDLLDLSKMESAHLDVQPEPVSVSDVIRDACALYTRLASSKGVTLTVEIHRAVPEFINTDPKRLRQVLVNLLKNAVKFTHHGSIHVHVRTVDAPVHGASSAGTRLGHHHPTPSYSMLECIVTDTGVGVDPAYVRHMFEPFTQADASTTRRYEGVGIGLRLSRQLARLLGGDLMLAPHQPSKGTSFIFTLRAEPVLVSSHSAAGSSAPSAMQPLYPDLLVHAQRSPAMALTLSACPHPVRLPFPHTPPAMHPVPHGSEPVADTQADHVNHHCPLQQQQQQHSSSISASASSCASFAESSPAIHAGVPDWEHKQSSTFCFNGDSGCTVKPAVVPPVSAFRSSPLPSSSSSGSSTSLASIARGSSSDSLIGPVTASSAAAQTSVVFPATIRVLVAEDNALNLKIFLRHLQQMGIAKDCIVTAVNGRAASERGTETLFDIILMDVHMPEMDGYDASRAIRQAGVGASAANHQSDVLHPIIIGMLC